MTNNEKFLELYSDSKYERPSVTVDGVIFRIASKKNDNYRKLPEKKLQVYLIKRQYQPFKDTYGVVGTFIDLNNELNETTKLCVKNKVNLQNYYFEQLFTFGETARDPRSRVISVSYLFLTNNKEELKNGEWFDVNLVETNSVFEEKKDGYVLTKFFDLKLSNENNVLNNKIKLKIEKTNLEEKKELSLLENSLAFDHLKIIYYAFERLKNKLEYTDIVFNLIDKEFTLTELKQCYELILGEHLLDANFRRKISNMVAPLNKFAEAKGHRTSQLYIHNPNWSKLNLD